MLLFLVQWLGKTILARLVAEINEVNAMLVRAGSDDVQIGGQSRPFVTTIVSLVTSVAWGS